MENNEMVVYEEENKVLGFSDFRNHTSSFDGTFTNIQDKKKMFNLKTNVDCKLNDCVGESIRVKEVLIRRWKKELQEPVTLEDGTLKEYETSISCVLVDDNGKSYATGSKIFTNALVSYLVEDGGAEELKDGIDIKITNVTTQNGNKALSFILI